MSHGSFKSFEELDCWKACRKVRQFIAKLVKEYLKDERFRYLDEKLITKNEYNKGIELINKALRLLNGYINYLHRCKEKSIN